MASQIQNLLERTLGDGARSTNFEVEFQLHAGIGENKTLQTNSVLVKSTALPTRTHQIIDFKYRGKSIPLMGQTKYNQTWECTFYLTEDHSVRFVMDNLFTMMERNNEYADTTGSRYVGRGLTSYDSTIKIYQTNIDDEKKAIYTLYNVFPIEIGAVTYDSSQVGVVAEMSVTFAYSYYEITYASVKPLNPVEAFSRGISKGLSDFKLSDMKSPEAFKTSTIGTGLVKTGDKIKSVWGDLLDNKPATEAGSTAPISSNPVGKSYDSSSVNQGLPTPQKLV